MIDRVRTFLDRPLDPATGRAILMLASAIFLGVAALVVLAGGRGEPTEHLGAATPRVTSAAPHPTADSDVDRLERDQGEERAAGIPRQDPQDRRGSVAARRAARALHTHRALQHVPYRRGELAIVLVGADRGRAVLRVSAPSQAAARQGWRAFLRRFHDRGEAYMARFVARRGEAGSR